MGGRRLASPGGCAQGGAGGGGREAAQNGAGPAALAGARDAEHKQRPKSARSRVQQLALQKIERRSSPCAAQQRCAAVASVIGRAASGRGTPLGRSLTWAAFSLLQRLPMVRVVRVGTAAGGVRGGNGPDPAPAPAIAAARCAVPMLYPCRHFCQ